jgi:hypothetical protein
MSSIVSEAVTPPGKQIKRKRGRAPLDPKIVERICSLYWNTNMTASMVAHRNGVSQGSVLKYAYLPENIKKHRPEQPFKTARNSHLYERSS